MLFGTEVDYQLLLLRLSLLLASSELAFGSPFAMARVCCSYLLIRLRAAELRRILGFTARAASFRGATLSYGLAQRWGARCGADDDRRISATKSFANL